MSKKLPAFQDDLLSSSDRQQIQIRTRTKEKRPKRAQNGNDQNVGAPSGSSWVPWPSRSGNIKWEEAVQRVPGKSYEEHKGKAETQPPRFRNLLTRQLEVTLTVAHSISLNRGEVFVAKLHS